MLKKHVPITFKGISIDALYGNCVIERMDKAVFDRDVLAVYNIDSVRIIPPLPEHIDRINFNVKAVKEIHAPDRGIHKSDSFHTDVSAII